MPSPITTIPVHLGDRSHSIVIGKNALARLPFHPLLSSPDTRAFIICDQRVGRLAHTLAKRLGRRCAGKFLLKGGENSKDISTLPKLYAAAGKARLDRRSIIIAMGGGTIGDVTGFFAATWLRGVRIVHVPTTLVAQVDSAMGGKTGINLPIGKNLVGAFHQPCLVMVDPTTLHSLPDREFRSGLAEVIKYGIISDPALFRRLETRMDRILKRDPAELSWIITRCCRIKAGVVSRDEREITGLRAILNFGHTLGHGIENAARYTLLHGEAIAMGMRGAVLLSQRHGGLSKGHAERMIHLISQAGLPLRIPARIATPRILAAMQLDKKSQQGKMRFVLASQVGRVKTGVILSESDVVRTIERLR